MICASPETSCRFYGALNFSLRTLVHYRVMVAFGKPFDYFLVEEPWRVYEVLENAELIINILTDWLRKNGCNATPEEVRRALSDKSAWMK